MKANLIKLVLLAALLFQGPIGEGFEASQPPTPSPGPTDPLPKPTPPSPGPHEPKLLNHVL